MRAKFWFEISKEMITWEREIRSSDEIQCEGFYWIQLSHVGDLLVIFC